MANSESEMRGYAVAAITGVLCFGGGWGWWLTSARSVYNFSWRDANAFHMGAFGFGSKKKFKKMFPGSWFSLYAPKAV